MTKRGSTQLRIVQVGQTETAAVNANVKYSGEIALVRYDNAAYEQIEVRVLRRGWQSIVPESLMQYESDRIVHPIDGFTYLRLSDTLIYNNNNWNTFQTFVYNMHNLL